VQITFCLAKKIIYHSKITTMSIKRGKLNSIIFLFILAGCSPKGAEYVDELDLVFTNYASNFDFQSKNTYAISDSVIKITGEFFEDPGSGKPSMVSPIYANVIVAEVKKNMEAYGWTLVDKNNNPDVIILNSAMTTTNIYYWYDWAYWGWWYPGYNPGWGWYYPGYYPGYVTGYRSGSVFTQMVDAKPTGTIDVIPVVWTSIYNGLAEGSSVEISARIASAIGRAFAQSPYLKIQ
jgi:hypothetical protein